jgi:hypothetical protein
MFLTRVTVQISDINRPTFYVVRTVHFGMILCNDQRNAQVFNLYIYFCLTRFGLSISPSSEVGVQLRQWFKFPGYGVSARALTPYPGDLNTAEVVHLPLTMG